MMKPPRPLFSVRVSVPATTANLGPGFDALGLALDLWNEVELTGWKAAGVPSLSVSVRGEGAGTLPSDKSNLVYRAVRKTFALAGRRMPSLSLGLTNRIPLARGLGSSSAAIVGGIAAAGAALKNPLSARAALNLAADLEGHPDNVTPAFAGGFCAAVRTGRNVRFVSWTEPALLDGLRAVLAVPDFELSTSQARRVLPGKVSREDAVFNASRAALFMGALSSRRFELLGEAMEDRLHQPYRARLVPGLKSVIDGAKRAGAYGAALSGAGPSVLALCPPARAAAAGKAMARAFSRRKVTASVLVLALSGAGVRVARVR